MRISYPKEEFLAALARVIANDFPKLLTPSEYTSHDDLCTDAAWALEEALAAIDDQGLEELNAETRGKLGEWIDEAYPLIPEACARLESGETA